MGLFDRIKNRFNKKEIEQETNEEKPKYDDAEQLLNSRKEEIRIKSEKEEEEFNRAINYQSARMNSFRQSASNRMMDKMAQDSLNSLLKRNESKMEVGQNEKKSDAARKYRESMQLTDNDRKFMKELIQKSELIKESKKKDEGR